VIGNVEAMTSAVDAVPPGGVISLEILLESHRRLLIGTALDAYGGQVRTIQNWIGISGYNPCAADFVARPLELVDGLLADLIDFCNDDGLVASRAGRRRPRAVRDDPPVVDGNGRSGRILIQLVLRRPAPRILPPVSLFLASRRRDYIHGLTGTRYEGAPDGPVASARLNDWIALFAGACRLAAAGAERFEAERGALEASWTQRLGGVRRDLALALLVRALPGPPLVTVNSAAALIGRPYQGTSQVIARLVEASILRQITVGRRNRAFEAPGDCHPSSVRTGRQAPLACRATGPVPMRAPTAAPPASRSRPLACPITESWRQVPAF
jgi:hypothetical protein